jgi:hypothetical protein
MEKIDKRKDRGPSKKTTNRWLKNLRNIKNEIDLKNHTSLQILTSVHEINNYWVTFLYKKNIVYKGEDGFLKWNEKIPVTVLLINSFRLFFEECKLNRKSKHLIKLNNNLNQKEMQSPTPPPVKKRGSYKKTTKPKVAIEKPKVTIEKPKTQIVLSDSIKKVGLIRSFWRWLY